MYLEEALKRIEKELKPLPEVLHFLQFCRQTRRGLMGLQGAVEELPQIDEEEDVEPSFSANR